NAIQALGQLDSVQPDLLIVDYAMPEMTGAELAWNVRERGVQIPIMFVTGYADMHAIEAVPAPTHLLKKPFEVDALVALVRVALAERETVH
ncbi:MAG: response regulator, partial [Pseudomonadota bacterium]|nr:response regulator [Pseudomonadota bacterium]